MSLFNSLLHSIKKNFEKDRLVKEKILAVIKEKSGITLREDNITIRDKTLIYTTSPTVTMALKLKRDLILQGLVETTEIRHIK